MAIHTEKTEQRAQATSRMNGWLALSPLFVFLAVYLAGSLVAHDFYKVPVAAAFIVASAYALIITRSVPGSPKSPNSPLRFRPWSFFRLYTR